MEIGNKKHELYDQEREKLLKVLKGELAVMGPIFVRNFTDAGIAPAGLTIEALKVDTRKRVQGLTLIQTLEEPLPVTISVHDYKGWVVHELPAGEFAHEKLVLTASGEFMRLVGGLFEHGDGYVISDDVTEICGMFEDSQALCANLSTRQDVYALRDCIVNNVRPHIDLLFKHPPYS